MSDHVTRKEHEERVSSRWSGTDRTTETSGGREGEPVSAVHYTLKGRTKEESSGKEGVMKKEGLEEHLHRHRRRSGP